MNTQLSVNINKVATLRNARGGNVPNLFQVAQDAVRFGAQGITVHPRPDERHIRYQDVRDLSGNLSVEFNIEGYPSQEFLNLVKENKPEQVTLVPDPPGVLTSNAGWKVSEQKDFLKPIVEELKSLGMRVSLFMDPLEEEIKLVHETGADRVELYTEAYADGFSKDPESAIAPYVRAAEWVQNQGLGLNAGHDLDLKNLKYFAQNIPGLLEVSIGHALISDALYYGLENTIQLYLKQLK